MSDLVCLGFQGKDTADRVLEELHELEREHLIDLEDACVVIRDPGGKLHLKQAVPLKTLGTARGATWGMLWGALAGLLFLNPLAGLVAGGALGAGMGFLSGSLSDYGINDQFIKDLGATLTPDSSALFILFRRATADKVLPEVAKFNPKVLRTSLTNEQEAKLRAALEQSTSGRKAA